MVRRATGSARRSATETGFYEAAVGLYAILVGLALFEPIEALAADVLDHPAAGDWSLRALAIGLIIEATLWFHALIAEMKLARLAKADASRHDSLPGVTGFTGYWESLADFWLGALVVVLLIVMAAAVSRGAAPFLAAFSVYAASDAIWEAVYLWRESDDAVEAWPDGRTPRAIIRQLKADRHLPATDTDARVLADGSDEIDRAWARAAWYWLAMAVAFSLGAALLAGAVALNPGLATTASLVWLVAVVAAAAADYWLFPYYYAA
jgi:hypothetical protein